MQDPPWLWGSAGKPHGVVGRWSSMSWYAVRSVETRRRSSCVSICALRRAVGEDHDEFFASESMATSKAGR